MVRLIKFRGKTKDGKWVFGSYFCMHHNDERTHLHHFIIPDDTPIPKDRPIEELQVEVIEDSIGQFTGLYDKDGREIYEGDILKVVIPFNAFRREKWRYRKVIFESGRFLIVSKDNIPICDQVGASCIPDYYVIGDIYDKSELLNQEETEHDR